MVHNAPCHFKSPHCTLAAHFLLLIMTSFPFLQHLSPAPCHSSAGAVARIPVLSGSKITETLHGYWKIQQITY